MKTTISLMLIVLAAIFGFYLRDLSPDPVHEWLIPWLRKDLEGDEETREHLSQDDEGEEEDDHQLSLSDRQITDMGITTSNASSGSLSFSLTARGKISLHPDKLVHVLPKMTGVAFETRKNIGDSVSEGEIIALVESKEIAGVKADFLAAIQKERLGSSIFEREKRLYEKRISSEYEFLQAKAAMEEAKIHLKLSEQKLHALGLNKEDLCTLCEKNNPDLRIYEIRSPLNGTVINRHISVGEYLEETAPIYVLADLSQVWIEIGVFPKDIEKVRVGQTAHIKIPGSSLKGEAEIIYVSPIIRDETIASHAIALLDNNDGRFRPGTFLTVEIDTDVVPAKIVIPKEALQEIEGHPVVFIRNPSGFELRCVQTGKNDSQNVEIVAGLFEGEEFASTNTFLLKAELGKGDVEDDD